MARFSNKRIVLFDLDGTLVDTAPDLAAAADHMLVALELQPVGEVRVRDWVGNGVNHLVRCALEATRGCKAEPDFFEQALRLFFAHYDRHLADHSVPYPGVTEALGELIDRGLRLAVVTNKPARFTEPLLEALDLREAFHAVVSGDSLTEKKPAPEPVQLAVRQCEGTAGQALMVGDSMTDVHAARQAGVDVIGVSYGYNHGDELFWTSPDIIIQSLGELPALLDTDKQANATGGHRAG